MEVHPQFERSSVSPLFIIGMLLLVAGAVLVAWVVINVITLFNDPQRVGIVHTLAAQAGDFAKEDKDLPRIPPEYLRLLGYVFAIFLMGIVSGLAKALIGGGISLLRPGTATGSRIEEHLEKIAAALSAENRTGSGAQNPGADRSA